jgi:hypothetical protein
MQVNHVAHGLSHVDFEFQTTCLDPTSMIACAADDDVKVINACCTCQSMEDKCPSRPPSIKYLPLRENACLNNSTSQETQIRTTAEAAEVAV